METYPDERLEAFCRAKNIGSLSELGAKIGASAGTFSIMKKRNRPPGGKVVRMLADAFPDLNTNWLLTGRGEMYQNGQGLTSAKTAKPTEYRLADAEEPDGPGPSAPGMTLSHSLERMLAGMTPEQQADYWRGRYEEEVQRGKINDSDWKDRFVRFPKASAEAAAPQQQQKQREASRNPIGFGTHQQPDNCIVLDFATGQRVAPAVVLLDIAA